MSRKLDNARKKLTNLQAQREQVVKGLRDLQAQADQTGELDQLEAIETKSAARRRLLAAIDAKIAKARGPIEQAEAEANEAKAVLVRKREADQREKVIRAMLALQSEIEELQSIGDELQSYRLGLLWQPSKDTKHHIDFTVDHVRGFTPEWMPA